MKVLKVTQSYEPFLERGGQAGTARELARGIAARGHHVTVLTADLSGAHRAGLGEKIPWGWRSIAPNPEAIYLRTAMSFRALTVNPSILPFCRERLAGFDIVHIYGLYDLLGPTVARFSNRAGIPYLIEPMGMFHPIDRGFFLKSLWHRLFGRGMFRNAWRIIATAELERDELVAGGIPADRILLRFNPVDSAAFETLPARGAFRKRWEIAPNQPMVLFLSRLIPRKGADLLIEAFAKALPKEGFLVIAGPEGEPGYLDRLRILAERCQVAQRVCFTGPLYGEEKKAAMADADVFALPSSYENFANAAAEAVACRLPVLVTDRCGIHSLIKNRAGLVVPREREAIAEALRTLALNPALRDRFRAGCPAVAAELSLESTVSKLEAFYRESASAGSGYGLRRVASGPRFVS
jgi:glycosyltransferase involved in cell wall biosynthesis